MWKLYNNVHTLQAAKCFVNRQKMTFTQVNLYFFLFNVFAMVIVGHKEGQKDNIYRVNYK